MTSVVGSVEDATRELSVWMVKLERGSAKAFFARMAQKAAAEDTDLLVLDADMVFGKDHLRSALYHAKRALSESTNVSDSLAMETLLYASGERQLSAAIRKMSVTDETTEVVVAALRGSVSEEVAWMPMPEGPARPTTERLLRFGIQADEMATASDRAQELVLERVAAVDVLKR